MPTVQRVRLALSGVLFAFAYGIGMKMLSELSVVAPFIVTFILIVGTFVAFKHVKAAAKIEGAKQSPEESQGHSLLGVIATVGIGGPVCIFLMQMSQTNPVIFVASVELIVFGFMIAIAMIKVFARIEIQTREKLSGMTV